jgi:hypothetical protein
MFQPRNMQSVRHSFLPGKMSLTALQEESNLRANKPTLPKKKNGDDDDDNNEKPDDGKKK